MDINPMSNHFAFFRYISLLVDYREGCKEVEQGFSPAFGFL
jgi:hypothetical protein